MIEMCFQALLAINIILWIKGLKNDVWASNEYLHQRLDELNNKLNKINKKD